jgi:hypothetical protein
MSFVLADCLTGDCDHFDATFTHPFVFYTYSDEKMRQEISVLSSQQRVKFLQMLTESWEVTARPGNYPDWQRAVKTIVPLLLPQDRNAVLKLLYRIVKWSGCDNEAAEFFLEITAHLAFPLSTPEKRAMYENLRHAEVNKSAPNNKFLELVADWNKW